MTESDGAARLRERVRLSAINLGLDFSQSVTRTTDAATASAKEQLARSQKQYDDDLDAYAAAEKATLPCYRTFCSGLGPNEAAGDDPDLAVYCQKAGYRKCPSCTARDEAEQALRALTKIEVKHG